ncbi:hypothetical protein ACUOAQ_06335, partial [Escherichia sp. SP-MK]
FSGQNPKSNRNFAVLGNMRQAVACTKAGNKGAEAALTALEMINVLKAIKA